MQIRPTVDADLPGILAIINREIAENFAHFGETPETLESLRAQFRDPTGRSRWVSAVIDAPTSRSMGAGATIGYAKGTPWKPREGYRFSSEVSVYIEPGHHGRGIGKALYTRLFADLEAIGYRRLIGGIALPNEASVRLHESMGMRKVAHFEKTGFKMGRWIDVAYWQLDVGSADSRWTHAA